MTDLSEHSGRWVGLSIQRERRISEAIHLTIAAGRIVGNGTDVDGDFNLDGRYDPTTGVVHLVRRYTRAVDPDPSATRALYDYLGRWDGTMIAGHWRQRDALSNGGPFEMWPDDEQTREELRIPVAEVAPEPVSRS